MVTFDIEYTDTFSGQANYCWVQRETIEVPEDTKTSTIIRRVKKQLGIRCKHRKTDYGDTIRLDLVGVCRVIFITFKEV